MRPSSPSDINSGLRTSRYSPKTELDLQLINLESVIYTPFSQESLLKFDQTNELPENKFNEGDIVTLKYTSLQGKIAEVIYDSKFNIYRYFVLFKLSGGLTLRSIYLENNLE